MTVVDVDGAESHQRADLLGAADTAAFEITGRPGAVADEAETESARPPTIDFTG
jgi:hypothetical protein